MIPYFLNDPHSLMPIKPLNIPLNPLNSFNDPSNPFHEPLNPINDPLPLRGRDMGVTGLGEVGSRRPEGRGTELAADGPLVHPEVHPGAPRRRSSCGRERR